MITSRFKKITFLLFIGILLFGFNFTVQSQPYTKHALVVGIDGARFDCVDVADTPNMDSIKTHGTWTHAAFAGGVLGTPSQQVTSSGPSWSTILTGVWTDKHGVTNNSFSGSNYDEYPCFFKRIKEHKPTAFLASIINWTPINTYIVTHASLEEEYNDQGVTDRVVELLNSEDPDVIFLHFDQLDGVGHGSGYSPTNPTYVAYIETLDSYIGEMLTALRTRPKYSKEDWLVLVTTDHGGIGYGHGGQSLEERSVFIYTASRDSSKGELSEPVGLTAIVPTVLDHLNIPINPDWNLDEEPLGTPKERATNFYPQNGAVGIDINTTLSWNPGVNALSHNIYFGTDSDLDNNFIVNQTETTYDPGELNERTNYFWRIDEVTDVDTITGPVQKFSTLSTVLFSSGHWSFDSTLQSDTSSLTGTFSGGDPVYVDGVVGNAVHLDGVNDYITLGTEFDLNYDADTDFSVSLWVRTDGWSSDPSIISNKDWNSGSNTGWIIACGSGSNTWQWNYSGANGSRKDYDPSGPVMNDGNWHHLCVTHDRDGNAKFYFDGILRSTIDISSSPGSIDPGMPTVIGNDGTKAYPSFFPGDIDEVNLYSYVLTQSDINNLFNLTGVESGAMNMLPKQHDLSPNYPNPFNPTTTIRYTLAQNENVNLSIFDMSGRRLKTLVDANQTAGEYSVRFDATDLASGIYIYQLKAGQYKQSRKMLLLR